MIMYSAFQKQQYKSRKMLTDQLKLVIDSFVSISEALKSTEVKKDLVKVFSNEKAFNDNFISIKEQILKGFLQAPLAKDLRRNIAYFQILSYLKSIQKFSSQLAYFIIKFSDKKISLDWFKSATKVLTSKLKKIDTILKDEDLDLINDILENDSDINILFEDVIKKIVNHAKTKQKVNQEIREYEIDFFLLAQNLERAGEKIKGISNQIYFIVTGEEKII